MKIKFGVETTMLPVIKGYEGEYEIEEITIVNETKIFAQVIDYLKADIKDLIFTSENLGMRLRKIYPEVTEKTILNRTGSYLKYLTTVSGELEVLKTTDGNKKPLYRFKE
ncbi:hypothetical protein MettiDRAFT_2359 [Methanolobus tindarius DSM 2278]|uniref:Uncharacterized protein n=1 Tax=Methanolobus tindarius DSM 2278 TaxID=1090322 RepID=W9DYS8_METTI|nr:hypothetical protein [Methanolobus tindarius]ETA68872.1 hypothetical protein MettiDRAFT_2359 [Methanolobus tindarius DSM 2278]